MNLHGWANLATIVLCFEAFVMGAVVGIIFYFLNRGMTWVLRQARLYLRMALVYLAQAQTAVGLVTDAVVSPFVAISSFMASVKGLWAAIQKDGLSRKGAA